MTGGISPEWLRELIERHAGPLELFAGQWTRNPADVVQDAYCQLLAQSVLPPNPTAWLYRTVRHRAMNGGRSERRREYHERAAAEHRARTGPEGTPLSTGPWGSSAVYSAEELQLALQSIADEQREVIVARLWGGLTLEEIADMTGTSVSTAHRRYYAGLESLRGKLIPWNLKSPTPTPPRATSSNPRTSHTPHK